MNDDPEIASQRVVCAALRHEGGAIICGPRHFDATMMAQLSAQGGDWRRAEQGFVDQFGKFLTREEAREIAEREGQVVRRFSCPEHMLFSEHLY